ncbi:MAG: GGDEF domain-containing protein [Treponema sp.]|nr:GGDEF domain-containing protein [Treponema sp.]
MQQNYKKPLGRSISIGCIAFIALLCLVLSYANQAIYKVGLHRRYEAHIKDIITFTKNQIDTDDLARCIDTKEKSPKYHELQNFIDTFKNNADIHYLYIIRPLNKNPSDNVMDIIAAMSTWEKENMPEMAVTLCGLTGEGYSVESVSKYLKAAESREITFFSSEWVKDDTTYTDYTGALPIFTSSGEYIGLLCVDIDITEINKVVLASTLTDLTIIFTLGLIFTILFIIWASYNIANPIKKLENKVTEFAYHHKGKENIDSLVIEAPDIHTNNEVESLANAVVKMSEDMRIYIENVIKAENKAKELSKLANKDALTKVGNKTAYVHYAEGLDKEISKGNAEFALVMIDLNHLKKINDTHGHEHGNEYIQKSCSIICHIFSHSPVFRIGGDEFIVILRDEEFALRRTLMNEAQEIFRITSSNEKLEPWQRLSAALGMTEFRPEEDSSINDVFNRADSIMYANKTAMKAGRKY